MKLQEHVLRVARMYRGSMMQHDATGVQEASASRM